MFCSVPTQRVIENYKKIAKINKKIPLWLHLRPKFVGKCREREKIKIIDPFRSYPTRNRKFHKNSKIFKKLKNTITASFQAKIGWKRLRKRENKNYLSVSFCFVPSRRVIENSKKIAKIFKKLKKYHYGNISWQNRLGKAEKERK